MKETVQVTREDREAAAQLACEVFYGNQWQRHQLNDAFREKWREVVDAARLSATSAPAGVEGWKLVPVEPTEAMLEAAYSSDSDLSDAQRGVLKAGFAKRYAAMIAAAPAPSGQEVAGDDDEPTARDDAAVYGIGFEVDGKRVHPGRVVMRQRAPVPSCAPATTLPASGVTVPEGMKAWNGGESAPEDWAGPHSDTLLRNGYRVKGGYRWTHCSEDRPAGTRGTDIIAYTPKPAALSTPSATPGEDQADRDRRLYEQGRRDERAGEPEAFI